MRHFVWLSDEALNRNETCVEVESKKRRGWDKNFSALMDKWGRFLVSEFREDSWKAEKKDVPLSSLFFFFLIFSFPHPPLPVWVLLRWKVCSREEAVPCTLSGLSCFSSNWFCSTSNRNTHKPAMHKSQTVAPGRQRFSAPRVGYGCTTAGRAHWDLSLCLYSVRICMRRMADFFGI